MKNREGKKYISFWVDDAEYEQIVSDAKNSDFTNLSKYIRTTLLHRPITIKKVKMTDRAIRNQINTLTAQIVRIGNNYNQAIRAMNEIVNAKKNNGDPVVNTRYLTFYVEKMANLMQGIKNNQNKIIDTIGSIKIDN